MNEVNTKPVKVPSIKELPPWLVGIVRRQLQLDKRYEKAYNELFDAYELLLFDISRINMKYGTDFSFRQVAEEMGGVNQPIDDDEFDDDEDEE
jgi:hypothetical protein